MTPKHEFEHDVKVDIDARVREGVKDVLEELDLILLVRTVKGVVLVRGSY